MAHLFSSDPETMNYYSVGAVLVGIYGWLVWPGSGGLLLCPFKCPCAKCCVSQWSISQLKLNVK